MTEYIERETPEGVCKCAHFESLHEPSKLAKGITVAGAGPCTQCACERFTWDAWEDPSVWKEHRRVLNWIDEP